MDPKLKKILESIFIKDVSGLSPEDIAFLNARRMYLTPEQILKYDSVLKKKEVQVDQVVENTLKTPIDIIPEEVQPAMSPPSVVEEKADPVPVSQVAPPAPVEQIAQPITFETDHSKDPDYRG